jgi:hypothetical protein
MTDYRIGRLSAPTASLDKATGRDVQHDPRPQLMLLIGKSRAVTIELSDKDLADLATQAVEALSKIRRAS